MRSAFSIGSVCFLLSLVLSAHAALHFTKITCQSKRVGAAVVFVLGFSVDGLLSFCMHAFVCLYSHDGNCCSCEVIRFFFYYLFLTHTTHAAVRGIKKRALPRILFGERLPDTEVFPIAGRELSVATGLSLFRLMKRE